jgi:hypothetical protein
MLRERERDRSFELATGPSLGALAPVNPMRAVGSPTRRL